VACVVAIAIAPASTRAEFGFIATVGPVDGYPYGIAVSDEGFVYVIEGTKDIAKFGPDGSLLHRWRVPFAGPGEDYADPAGIAAGASDVYVIDQNRELVQRFDPSGQLISQWGGFGDDPGEFFRPQAIATDDHGFVYVADSLNARIQKFTGDGVLVDVWGEKGRGPGELEHPTAIATDGHERVFVGDESRHRVIAYDTDGTFLTEWGRHGEGDGEFHVPREIAADQAGNVYVSDYPEFARVQHFSSGGEYLGEFGCPGGGPDHFGFFAHGLATTPAGELLYLDDSRALVFGEGGTPPSCVMEAEVFYGGQAIDDMTVDVACFTHDCDVEVKAKIVGPTRRLRLRPVKRRIAEGVATPIELEFRRRSHLRTYRRASQRKGFRKRHSVFAEVGATDASGATASETLEISIRPPTGKGTG
jgi:sugar lactone lactonase YvrE